MGCLGFQLWRTGEPMVNGVGITSGHGLCAQHINRDAILGVHHREHAGLSCHLHGTQDLTVIGVVGARVGHEQFDRRDALAFDQGRNGGQRFVVDAADRLMKGVIDDALALCLRMARLQAVEHSFTHLLRRKVDNGGDPAPRCRCGPARKRV